MPSHSLLLLSWNHENFVDRCIAAIAAQSRPPDEIIYLDNASSDATYDLAAKRLRHLQVPVRTFRNSEPKPIAENLNRLLAEARTTHLTFHSTDDWLDPRYVEIMMDAVFNNESAGWISCLGWLERENGGGQIELRVSDFRRKGSVTDAILDGDEAFWFVTCCFQTEALQAIKGFDPNMPIEDRDAFYRLSKTYQHVQVPFPLTHYRRHSAAASADQQFMIDGWERFYAKHAADFTPRQLRRQRAEMYRRAAAVLVDQGKLREATASVVRSIGLSPTNATTWRTFGYLVRKAMSRA